jgi:hypothetical protein
MFKKDSVPVWVGILALSCMFLMGNEFWIQPTDPRYVFVTDFGLYGNMITGGPDQVCQSDAQEYGLTGVYKAWISDSTSSPDTTFDKGGRPYILRNGETVADDWDDLTDGTIQHSINQYADGASVANLVPVWTNTWEDGTAVNNQGNPLLDCCDDWTSDSSDYTGNIAFVGGIYWSHSGDYQSCLQPAHLFCFEQ